jgi:hypothetical protein
MTKTKLLAAVALATMLCAAAARADEAADTATARALGIEGVALADAGKCGEATEKLERAEKLHHAPTTATRLGECEIENGKLVVGTERLQRVIRERLPANAHPAFAQAQTRAQTLLEKTLPRLATVRVGLVGSPSARPVPSTITITVDGEKTSSEAILDTDRRIDPGTHTIEVKADGFFPVKESAVLHEGESKNIRLEMKRDPSWRPPPHPTPSERAVREEEPPSSSGGRRGFSKAPAIVAFGLSAVGLGLGIYSAMVVDDKSSRLQGGCDANRVCPPELQRDISDAKTWATVSTASFIGAGVFAATGITLWVLSTPSNKSTQGSGGIRVRPTASGALLDGVF